MTKAKNAYFYSKDADLLKRLREELRYAGRYVGTVEGGIVQYAYAPVRRKKDEDREEKPSRDNKDREQRSKRERWLNG